VNWKTAAPIVKDILLTGTGVFCILWEVFSAHPSGLILGTGLVLTVPSTAEHVRALLPSVGGGQSSESSPQPTAPRSQPSRQGGSGGPGDG
jgi:hypothetical protein